MLDTLKDSELMQSGTAWKFYCTTTIPVHYCVKRVKHIRKILQLSSNKIWSIVVLYFIQEVPNGLPVINTD